MLKVKKEKGFIVTVIYLGYVHRAAKIEAVVVSSLARPQQMPIPVVGERRAGIERLIHEVIVCRSVELVRARSHGEIEKTAARLPQLGRVIAGLDREFLYRVNAALSLRLHGVPTVGGVLSFDPHGLRVRRCPVNSDIDVRRIS